MVSRVRASSSRVAAGLVVTMALPALKSGAMRLRSATAQHHILRRARGLPDGLVMASLSVLTRGAAPSEAQAAKTVHNAVALRRMMSYFREASRPDPAVAYSGCTLTTPNWRSSTSRWAAIIHRKLMEPPGAATLGW